MHMGYLVNIVAEKTFFTLFGHPVSGHYHCVEEGAEATRQQRKMTGMEELKSFIFTNNIIDICDTIQIC